MNSVSLPYIDLEYNDPVIRQQVDLLVQNELLSSTPLPNLPSLNPPPTPMNALDMNKYTQPTSSEDLAVVESMQHDRVHHLSLLKEHGPLAWAAHLHQTECILEHLEKKLEAQKKALTDLNRQRKTEQLEIKAHLDYLQHQIDTTKQSNLATLLAIQELERQ
ncbi:hypothetical protein HMI54_001077 [Coelomomyces lativittatus]|nr:hypothetical protein HMI54_001077 [Coelomomyces lativittatus]